MRDTVGTSLLDCCGVSQVHKGVKGFVVEEIGGGIENAIIEVQGIEKNITTAKFGDFWRLLIPGTYNLFASASG